MATCKKDESHGLPLMSLVSHHNLLQPDIILFLSSVPMRMSDDVSYHTSWGASKPSGSCLTWFSLKHTPLWSFSNKQNQKVTDTLPAWISTHLFYFLKEKVNNINNAFRWVSKDQTYIKEFLEEFWRTREFNVNPKMSMWTFLHNMSSTFLFNLLVKKVGKSTF